VGCDFGKVARVILEDGLSSRNEWVKLACRVYSPSRFREGVDG